MHYRTVQHHGIPLARLRQLNRQPFIDGIMQAMAQFAAAAEWPGVASGYARRRAEAPGAAKKMEELEEAEPEKALVGSDRRTVATVSEGKRWT